MSFSRFILSNGLRLSFVASLIIAFTMWSQGRNIRFEAYGLIFRYDYGVDTPLYRANPLDAYPHFIAATPDEVFRSGKGEILRSVYCSPSGRFIYFQASLNTYRVRSNASELIRVLSGIPTAGIHFSPDDLHIVFASAKYNRGHNDDLYIADSDGSDINPLTDSSVNELIPRWSPDGKRIAFVYAYNGSDGIGIIELDSLDRFDLPVAKADITSLEWSPDGWNLLFEYQAGDRRGLATIRRDGSQFTRLIEADHYLGNAKWSPDGQRIAFSSTLRSNSFSNSIFTIEADGSGLRVLTTQSYGSHQWSPDGVLLSYLAPGLMGTQISVISADGRFSFPLVPRWRDGMDYSFNECWVRVED